MLQLLQSTLSAAIFCFCIAVLGYIGRWLAKGYSIRRKCHSMPGPPHSMLWGHLKAVGEASMANPYAVHPHVYPTQIRKKYNLPNTFVMDTWPFGYDPIIAVMDPVTARQVVDHSIINKHPSLQDFTSALAGEGDIVASNDTEQWTKWRKMLNPGFSSQHLSTLVPGIVDDVHIYVERLEKLAESKEVFRLEEMTTRLTIDVIGKVVLDINFNMQRGDNPCITALREQIQLLPNEQSKNPLVFYHPWSVYRRYRNNKIIRDYIGKVLDERFATTKPVAEKKQRKRTVIDLVLANYASSKEDVAELVDEPTPKMNETFREGAITQIIIFLFAGHDTTSSTMCYVLYLLKKHPQVLQKLSEEHEKVLGPIGTTADAIKKDPYLLNKLEYTLCVIKEVLRLFPAASAPRKGDKNLNLRDPKTGDLFNTEGFMCWIIHHGIGHSRDIWGETVEEFIPERFLPENAHNIPEGAWRPFELGPRSCIGQNLAIIETRIIMALVCRRFEITAAYDSLDQLANDGSFFARSPKHRRGPQNVDGETAYQILIGTAKPREGMPVRVRRLNEKK